MQGNSAIDKQNDPKLSLKQSSKTCGGIFHTLYYNIIIERVPEKRPQVTLWLTTEYQIPFLQSLSGTCLWIPLVKEKFCIT